MFKFSTLVFLSLFSIAAIADTQLSLYGSVNYSVPETDTNGISDEESGLGLGVGIRALMGINDQLSFRSGAGLVQRNYTYNLIEGNDEGDLDFTFTYLNIPLTLHWKASPKAGFFFGTAIFAMLDDSCDAGGEFSSCEADDPNSLMFPVILGFNFSFTPKLGMEISYEHAVTETAKDVKVHAAVASLLYHFDN